MFNLYVFTKAPFKLRVYRNGTPVGWTFCEENGLNDLGQNVGPMVKFCFFAPRKIVLPERKRRTDLIILSVLAQKNHL